MTAREPGRAITYLPIDGLIASLEDALHEIAEIESRRGPDWLCGGSTAQLGAQWEQGQRLTHCRQAIGRALALAGEYAKGPTP